MKIFYFHIIPYFDKKTIVKMTKKTDTPNGISARLFFLLPEYFRLQMLYIHLNDTAECVVVQEK